MKDILKVFKEFLALTSFLTIIPVRPKGDLKESAEGFFMVPLIGLIVGVISSLPEVLPEANILVKGILVTSLLYALSGLIHLDGFADFIDASSAKTTKDGALKILKEPWRGAKAISATTLIILFTYAGASDLSTYTNGMYLIITITITNYESLFLLATLAKPSTYEGLGKLFIENSSNKKSRISNTFAVALALIPLVIYGGREVLIAVITSFSVIAITLPYSLIRAYKVLGFVNGDVLGYELEVSRSLSLVAASLILGFLR